MEYPAGIFGVSARQLIFDRLPTNKATSLSLCNSPPRISRDCITNWTLGILRLKCDGTRAEARFRLSAKRTSPFKSAGESVQSTTGSRGVRISGSNAATPCSEVVWRVLTTHSIRKFPLHFPSRASPCAIVFQVAFILSALCYSYRLALLLTTVIDTYV